MGKGNSRNKLCDCGSGQKYKNCCLSNRKDRTSSISIDPKNLDILDGVAISSDGKLSGITDKKIVPFIGEVSMAHGYMREKGLKILNQGPLDSRACFLNPNLSLVEFDHVFVIDTNTKKIRGDKISVGCFVHCEIGHKSNKGVAIKYALLGCYEYWNIKGKEENFVWIEIIQAIQRTDEFSCGNIGILVDSDLGNHEKFNRREMPVYEDFYLPENFKIFYSSSDGGKENIPNKLIGFCDKKARQVLQWVLENPTLDQPEAVEERPYSHFRQWKPDTDYFLDDPVLS